MINPARIIEQTKPQSLTVSRSQNENEQALYSLARHIGRIEANLMRINALGERLVESAHLDPEEFNFKHEVGMGGVSSPSITPEKTTAWGAGVVFG